MTTDTIKENAKDFGVTLFLSLVAVATYVGLKMNINADYMVLCIIAILTASFFIPAAKSRLGWGNVVYMFFAIIAIQATDNPYFQLNMGLVSVILVMVASNVAISYIRNLKNLKNAVVLECVLGFVLGCCIVVLSNAVHNTTPINIDNAPSLTRNAGW